MEGNAKALVMLGEGDNSLSSRNDKNSTILAGAGNDSLIFYNATNLSVSAGEGNDKIFDYQSGDMLRILKSDGTAGGKFKKSSYKDGTLSLTISSGGEVLFDNVTTSTDFNINGTIYKISNSKLVKK